MMVDNGPAPIILTNCRMCHTEFDYFEHLPKVLKCGHTLCLFCLRKSQEDNNGRNELLTDLNPLQETRIEHVCPLDKLPIFGDVDIQPTNCLILALVDKLEEDRRKKAAKHVTDPFLPCHEDHNHESDVWCQDCKQTYCDDCDKTVCHRSKVLKRHKRVPVSLRPVREIPACPVHPEKDASYVCLEHIESNRKKLDELHNRITVSVNVLKKKSNDSEEAWKTFVDKEKIASGRKKIEDYHNRQLELALSRYDNWVEVMKEEFHEEHIKCSADWHLQERILKRVSNKRRRKDTLYDINSIMEEGNRNVADEEKTYPTLQDYDFPDGMGPIGPVVVRRNDDRTIPVEMPVQRAPEPVPEQLDAPGDPVVIDVDDEVVVDVAENDDI